MNEKFLQLIREVLGLEQDAPVTDEHAVQFLRKHAKPAFQAAFDDGHGVALAQQQRVIDRLTGEKTALETERDRIKADLVTARADKPDLERLQGQIDEKDAEIESLKKARADDKREFTVNSAVERLRARLAPELTEGYEEILVERPATKKLFSFDEEGNFRVLRPGKVTPYSGDETAQIEALAAELLKDVKPAFRRSSVESGSGSGTEGGGASGGGASLFDKAREDAKNQSGAPAVDVEKELARRLGLGAV
jgi:hypothetical protein